MPYIFFSDVCVRLRELPGPLHGDQRRVRERVRDGHGQRALSSRGVWPVSVTLFHITYISLRSFTLRYSITLKQILFRFVESDPTWDTFTAHELAPGTQF